jgi:hypothetical protein
LEPLGQLRDLSSLTIDALLPELLLLFGILHLDFGSASLGSDLEEVRARTLGLCTT